MRLSSRAAGALGALLVALAVAVGAFGAHTLEGRLPATRLGTLETSVRYQTYGGLGLLAMALVARAARRRAGAEAVGDAAAGAPAAARTAASAEGAAALLALGVLLFCGALYLLAAGGPSLLGLVAPFGGAAMIAAWLWLALALWREPVT